MKKTAFTLVELMVVIAIIAILAVGSVSSYRAYLQKAYDSQVSTTTNMFQRMTWFLKDQTGATLRDIVSSGCSDCPCRPSGVPGSSNLVSPGDNLQNLPETHQCRVRWRNLLSHIEEQVSVPFPELETDPWGSPYLVDENEGEFSHSPCRKDSFLSVGPNGVYETTVGPAPMRDLIIGGDDIDFGIFLRFSLPECQHLN